jgi:hypothetical protein
LIELVSTDDELAGLAIDVTEAGLSGDDAVETARLYRRADVNSLTS